MKFDFNMPDFIRDLQNCCSKSQTKKFLKGDIITSYIEKRNQLCILITGEADLVRYDFNGNKTIIGHFIKDSLFGETFYPTNTNNELFVIAKKDCEVVFIHFDSLLNKCKSNCSFHKILYYNLSEMFLNKIVELNTRIELLSIRNTRDKLLSYFNILSSKSLKKTFIIPFSFTDLADYLSVDRSAMMRELKILKDDGFIKKDGNKITLLY